MNYQQPQNLNNQTITHALKALADELAPGSQAALVLIGGAAGLLSGNIPGTVTTSDVDAIQFQPPEILESVLSAADRVAEKQGISKGWLNIEAGLFVQALPLGWEDRRILVLQHTQLHVYTISRADLIAMKFYAHRSVDLEHLQYLNPSPAELQFTVNHFQQLLIKLPFDLGRINMALFYVQHWNDPQ